MESIIKGLIPEITTGEPISLSYGILDRAEENKQCLTDGSVPGADLSDAGWVRFYRGGTRLITFDLGGNYLIGGFSARFMQYREAGVYTPREVKLMCSDDGISFSEAFTVASSVSPSCEEPCISVFETNGTAAYRARFVRFVFECEVNVFASAFCVYEAGRGIRAENLPSPARHGRRLGFARGSDGMKNGVIIYGGYWNDTMKYPENYVKNTVSDLLPFVGYIDGDGRIADTFFESVYFLSLQSRTPSGGLAAFTHGIKDQATVADDWIQFLDNLFEDDYNIGALDKAVGRVKEALSMPDYRVNVHIQLYYPHISDRDFGCGLRTDTLENRLEVYRWFMENTLRRFEEKKYANLRFGSFYQGCESVPFEVSDDEEALFTGANAIAHSLGVFTTWIPSYLGAGFARWKEMGFDFACMQPNHMFHDWDSGMLCEFSETCTKYGLGVELELNHTAVYESERRASEAEKYFDYLRGAYYYGYLGCATAMYQGAGPGYLHVACYSDDPEIRKIYDYTYLFIKGTLAPEVPRISATRFCRRSDGSYALSLSASGGGDIFTRDVSYKVIRQGAHGAAAVNDENELIYIPGYTFSGWDKVTVLAENHGLTSELKTLVINDIAGCAVRDGAKRINSICAKPENRKLFAAVSALSAAAALALVFGTGGNQNGHSGR